MAAHPQPNSIYDPYQHLQIVLNPDGSLTRNMVIPTTRPTPVSDPHNPIPVLSKDFTFNPSNDNNWLRIYLPSPRAHHPPNKLPVLFYFHGGGFILCSAAHSPFHAFCAGMAADLPAVVISVEYRLAPEHRLPAAYHDAMDALHWIKTNRSEVDWLRDCADFSNCFLMGTSAGANMAYHVGLRVADRPVDLEPLKIRGLILHHPFFGGTRRTPTEVRSVNDPIIPPAVADMMWDLSLPVGAGRDHEFCNPTAGGGSKGLEEIRALGWKVLVTGYDGDALYDHQTAVVEMMKKQGVAVESVFKQGGYHAQEIVEGSKAKQLYLVIRTFIV